MKYDRQVPISKYENSGKKEWKRLEKTRDGELLYHVHLDIMKRHIKPTDSVIELGAGSGRFSKELVCMCKSLTVSDLTAGQLEINKEKMKELGLYDKIKEYKQLDITDLSEIPNEGFDCAVCVGGAINYLFDMENTAVSEMLRILKKGGRLILGSMSLLGAMIYNMNTLVYDTAQFGVDATRWVIETGQQEPEHYPVENKHYVHIMTCADMDALFYNKPVKIIEKSSAGLLSMSGEEPLNRAKENPELWKFLIETEIKMTKRPGTLDCGNNIIYVIEKL